VRPSGADNYLKWRRSIDEHLELRRLSWDEYAMFNWLCTKASPRTGTLRTSWPTLAGQTGLSPTHVEKLCRGLKQKRYVWYPNHRGQRGRLVEVEIDKYPVVGNTYTDLSARFEEVLTEVPSEVGQKTPMDSASSTSGRNRHRQETTSLRVRRADAVQPEKFQPEKPERPLTEPLLSKTEALARAPAALRETLELYCFKTGRQAIDPADLECLYPLNEAHTPATIQKAITRAVERFARRGQDPAALTLQYLWESLRHYTTRKPRNAQHEAHPNPPYPTGLTRLW